MRKYLIFILLILISCEKDFIEPQVPQQTSIFDVQQSSVTDGQDISFEVITNENHQLVITTLDGSVLAKESFQPQVGINTRKIYTNSFKSGEYYLILKNETEELQKTSIILE